MSETSDNGARMRRLTTILAADVANYSGLMAADEEGTLETLTEYRSAFVQMFGRYGGRLFNTAGDSILAEFGSAVEAIRCAIEIQDELYLRNSKRATDARMQFRIGVNIGDVLVDGENLYGDGVNVAARLEALAPPGGICAAASVYEVVKGKISFEFEDIGPQSVKNIKEPIRAFRLEAHDASGERPVPNAVPVRRVRPKAKLALGGAALALVVLAAVGGLWATGAAPFGGHGQSAGPSEAQAQAERMKPYVGMTVYGKASYYKQQWFTVRLMADGKATMARRTDQVDKLQVEHGRWWVTAKSSICFEFPYFGRGSTVCRILKRRSGEVVAVHLNPDRPAWVLRK